MKARKRINTIDNRKEQGIDMNKDKMIYINFGPIACVLAGLTGLLALTSCASKPPSAPPPPTASSAYIPAPQTPLHPALAPIKGASQAVSLLTRSI